MSSLRGIIAHRGASAWAPENTMAAFEKAVELGADGIEVDVQLTADRVLVVMHDDTLDRTTNGNGPLSRKTLAQLKDLDAGSWFDPKFAGEQIPTLQEVLVWARGRCRVDIEVKTRTAREIPVQDFARLISDAEMEAQVAITSFERDFVESLQRHCPGFEVGLLISPLPPLKLGLLRGGLSALAVFLLGHKLCCCLSAALSAALVGGFLALLLTWLREVDKLSEVAERLQADALLPHWLVLSRSLAVVAKARGLTLVTWTVNKGFLARYFQKLGADGIITDKPDLISGPYERT